jgi:hypothetical protein
MIYEVQSTDKLLLRHEQCTKDRNWFQYKSNHSEYQFVACEFSNRSSRSNRCSALHCNVQHEAHLVCHHNTVAVVAVLPCECCLEQLASGVLSAVLPSHCCVLALISPVQVQLTQQLAVLVCTY